MALIDELKKLVGKASDSAADLEAYSKDMSLQPAGLPEAVVWPESTEEVSAVVKYACENNIPVVPVSSQTHRYGSTIPKQGGIMIDMKNMNKILEIDPDHRFVRFQPGVTWKQMYEALDKEGLRIMMPLTAISNRSVLSDTLDRCVITNTVYDYGEITQSMEIVYGDGSIFRAGSGSVNRFPGDGTFKTPSRGVDPSGPGLDFYRLIQGSQGTMGIVTWMSTKIEWKSKIDKVYFAGCDDLKYVNEFLYKVMPRRIGQEIVLLNKVDLATIIADSAEEIAPLCAKLPEWVLVFVISGVKRRPEEKIAYEEHYLNEALTKQFRDLSFKESLPGFPGLGRKMLSILKTPWEGKYWKEVPSGAYEDLFFIARPERAQEYIDIIKSVAAKYTYPLTQIGAYEQPIEHNRACQVEVTFFYDPENEAEKEEIAKITYEAAAELLAKGAQFTRPYGNIVPLIYDRAGNYTSTLKVLKNIFDEKNILNPGTLCF
jgi:hypothetical protein